MENSNTEILGNFFEEIRSCHLCDRAKGYLLYMMGDKKPMEIPSMNIEWIVGRYMLVIDALHNRLFSDEFLLSDEGSDLLGIYLITLENMLNDHGIEFRPSRGITNKGQRDFLEKCRKKS